MIIDTCFNNCYYKYFSSRRPFALSNYLAKIIGKPMLFAANNGWAKYYQVDKNHKIQKIEKEF
jgi:gamma-glutamylputrescine oxidase